MRAAVLGAVLLLGSCSSDDGHSPGERMFTECRRIADEALRVECLGLIPKEHR